ncbi:hypothetical protein K0U07_00550 [bacterium]|nr:hypothetical protein [bacterium]
MDMHTPPAQGVQHFNAPPAVGRNTGIHRQNGALAGGAHLESPEEQGAPINPVILAQLRQRIQAANNLPLPAQLAGPRTPGAESPDNIFFAILTPEGTNIHTPLAGRMGRGIHTPQRTRARRRLFPE